MDGRKAGEVLTGLFEKARGVDDAYSARIGKMYDGSNPVITAAAYTVGGAHPSLRKAEPDYRDGASKLEQAVGNASVYAIPAANAVPKYVLPAAGVTLAGKGLMDLATAFGGPADQQQPGQIAINDLPQAAQSLIKGNPAEEIVAGMRGYGPFANLSQGELKHMLEAVENTPFYQ